MRIPKYIQVLYTPGRPAPTLQMRVKWWGWPLLTARTLRGMQVTPWYMRAFAWAVLYPWVTVRMMARGGAADA